MELNNLVNSLVRNLPIPNIASEGIIMAKDFILDKENRENIFDTFKNLFNNKGNIIENIWNVKETMKNKGVKEGVSKAVDMIISNAKNNKIISKDVANMLKSGKDIIVENLCNSKELFKGQEEYLNNINIKYDKWVQAFEKNDVNNMQKLEQEINNDAKLIMPTKELIYKLDNMKNINEISKNKQYEEITDLEKEILNKVA